MVTCLPKRDNARKLEPGVKRRFIAGITTFWTLLPKLRACPRVRAMQNAKTRLTHIIGSTVRRPSRVKHSYMDETHTVLTLILRQTAAQRHPLHTQGHAISPST